MSYNFQENYINYHYKGTIFIIHFHVILNIPKISLLKLIMQFTSDGNKAPINAKNLNDYGLLKITKNRGQIVVSSFISTSIIFVSGFVKVKRLIGCFNELSDTYCPPI
jgi:hypothetical protein